MPTLVADLTEIVTIRETLQNVDRLLVDNQTAVKDALSSFESYTATLAGEGDAMTSVIRKTGDAIDSFGGAMEKVDGTITKIDGIMPSLTSGASAELYRSVKSFRELIESFDKRAATFMNEGRQSLGDVSEAVNKVDRKLEPGTGR